MRRPDDQDIELLLRGEDLDTTPPPELAARLKAEIPDDLGTGTGTGTEAAPAPEPAPSDPRPRRRWLLATAAAVVLTAGASLLVMRLAPPGQPLQGAAEQSVASPELAADRTGSPEAEMIAPRAPAPPPAPQAKTSPVEDRLAEQAPPRDLAAEDVVAREPAAEERREASSSATAMKEGRSGEDLDSAPTSEEPEAELAEPETTPRASESFLAFTDDDQVASSLFASGGPWAGVRRDLDAGRLPSLTADEAAKLRAALESWTGDGEPDTRDAGPQEDLEDRGSAPSPRLLAYRLVEVLEDMPAIGLQRLQGLQEHAEAQAGRARSSERAMTAGRAKARPEPETESEAESEADAESEAESEAEASRREELERLARQLRAAADASISRDGDLAALAELATRAAELAAR